MSEFKFDQEKLEKTIEEIAGFVDVAESTLKEVEENMMENREKFSIFTDRMIAIRGTAEQLRLPDIAQLAGLGEEISVKGTTADSPRLIRKCVWSLWDAITSLKYLLENHNKETGEEQQYLTMKLERTLKALGGARPTVSNDEIAELLKNR